MRLAPVAIMRALSLGQPCRGLTMRSRESPKFAMARAAAPIFSPSCGSTRTMTGPGPSLQSLVLSVPAPGISPPRVLARTAYSRILGKTARGAQCRLSPPACECYSERRRCGGGAFTFRRAAPVASIQSALQRLKRLHAKDFTPMAKIKVANPVVEMDGDE